MTSDSRTYQVAQLKIWNRLHWLFDTDDGSLPEIRLTQLSRDGVNAVFELVQSKAKLNSDATFWHKDLNRDEPLIAYSHPALLVVSKTAEPFHVLASGLSVDGVVLPDLGVFVFADEVTLDYRMGSDWDESRVIALFELLRRLNALDSNAIIRLDEHVLPKVERLFWGVWKEYEQLIATSSTGE